ncbi:MAG: class I SAM-dependent methyltransferase [Chthoniobacterales bacterium]
MSAKEQSENMEGWKQSAQYWDKYRPLIAQMFAPLTSLLVEEARIRSGQRVLDIGGGGGEPSLTISRIVGEKGSVMYTDPIAEMLETARNEANELGLTNISFTQCSGDDLPFADRTFDVAVGRLSAMFFADPAAALRQALRVVVDGGRVSFVVWGSEAANPFFSAITDLVEECVGPHADASDAPDPFRFAVPGKLAEILKGAGATDVIERHLAFPVEAAISFDQFWQLRTEMSQTLREKTAALTAAQLAAVKRASADAARPYFVNGKMSFPAEAFAVTGRTAHS